MYSSSRRFFYWVVLFYRASARRHAVDIFEVLAIPVYIAALCIGTRLGAQLNVMKCFQCFRAATYFTRLKI